MGPQLIPLLVAGAGTAMQMSAARKQEKDRRHILNRQLEREEQATDESVQMVQDEGRRFDPLARQEALAANERKSFDQAQADIQGAGGASIATAGDAANVSDDFLKTKAARAVDEGNRLTAVAREAAKARAPGMLSLDDSLSMAGMAGGQGNLWGRTKNMNTAANMEAQAVNEPLYGSLGRIASAAGGAMAAGGYGQKTTPPPSTKTAGINFGGYRG